jgi:AcrR family transcriptional regulator
MIGWLRLLVGSRAMADSARAVEKGGGAIGRTPGRHERGKETRRELIRAATKLWSTRGFDAVTVEEICAEAGVGRTTFYLHFESKEQLLASLAAATATGVAADLEEVRASDLLDAQIDAFVLGVARRIEDVPQSLVLLVLQGQRATAMKLDAEQRAKWASFADILRGVLVDASRRGDLARVADPAELGEILGAVTMDAIETWASGRLGDMSLGVVLRRRFAVVLDQYRA